MNNEDKRWTVYKHTFPNNKIYIGITSFNVLKRWKKDGHGYQDQGIIGRAIKKYGWDNIQHEILFENLSEKEAKEKEQELIEFYHSYYLDPLGPGYNMTRGGEGKRKLDYGKMEQLYKNGLNAKEIAEYLNCCPDAVRVGLHNLGYGPLQRKKPVSQYDLNGNFIKTYPSITEASKETGIDYRNIGDVLKNKGKQTHGYRWTYYNGTIIEKLEPITITLKTPWNNQQYIKKDDFKICQYDLYGYLIKIYDNIKEAAKENNIAVKDIKKALSKPNGTSGKTYWKIYDENEDNNIYIIDKNVPIRFKPVLQYDMNNNFIKSYSSVGDAAKAVGTNTSNICSAINKRVESCKGYYWKYYEQQI